MATKDIFTSKRHEQESRWTAVDAYTFKHSHPESRPNHKSLQDAHAASRDAGLPDISVAPVQGKFMALICRAQGVTHALELGTLGGYSAIWLASENPQLKLTTIEYDAHHAAVARKNIEAAGVSAQVEVIQGAGMDVLPRLREEILAGRRPRFGLTFIDADKVNNWNYFDIAVEMSLPKAIVCVDNVVRQGKLADQNDQSPNILGARAVIEKAGKDPRVDTVVLQSVSEKNYDGCLWAVVN